MNRTMLMYGIIAVVVISVGVATFNFFTKEVESITGKNKNGTKAEREIRLETSENNTVKNEISRIHSLLNELVGWNGYRNIRWDDRDMFNDLLDRAKNLKVNIIDNNLREDILNMIACIEIAIENRDADGLLYAHRIIHDLDYYVNGNNSDGNIYNVTTYGNDSDIKVVLNYIN